MAFHWSDAEFTLWSFISHLMLAIVVVSGINLVFILFGQNREATIAPARRSLCAGAILALVCVVPLSRKRPELCWMGCQCLRRYACGGAYAVWILDRPPVRWDRRVDHAGSVSRASREWGVAARLIGTLGLGDADFRIISQ